jgi:hypothetical protein
VQHNHPIHCVHQLTDALRPQVHRADTFTHGDPLERGREGPFAISADGESSGVDGLRFPSRRRNWPKPASHDAFPAVEIGVSSLSHVRPGRIVGQAAGIHQLVQKDLTSPCVHAQQTGCLRQSEAEARQIDVFAKKPAFH